MILDLGHARALRRGAATRQRMARRLRSTADVLDRDLAARRPTCAFLILVGGAGAPQVMNLGDVQIDHAREATAALATWTATLCAGVPDGATRRLPTVEELQAAVDAGRRTGSQVPSQP